MFKLTDLEKDIFFLLWKADCCEYEFFPLAKQIFPKLTFKDWDQEYQKHNLLHSDKDEALKQFESVVFLLSDVCEIREERL